MQLNHAKATTCGTHINVVVVPCGSCHFLETTTVQEGPETKLDYSNDYSKSESDENLLKAKRLTNGPLTIHWPQTQESGWDWLRIVATR